MVSKALAIMLDAHKNQVDKGGNPYILHPLTVASRTQNDDEFVCALLHDVVEDSDYTMQDLIDNGIPNHIIEALKLLTHDKSIPYLDYVAKIKQNKIARAVKLLDLQHNSDLSRLKVVTDKDLARIAKYQQAIQLLQS